MPVCVLNLPGCNQVFNIVTICEQCYSGCRSPSLQKKDFRICANFPGANFPHNSTPYNLPSL